MLTDVKFIARSFDSHQGNICSPLYQVAASRYEIMFKDGSSIGLHQVYANGAPLLMLRALRQGTMLMIFDLSKLCPSLGRELPPSPERDVAGIIFFTLRDRFKNANACTEAVHAVHKTIVPELQDEQRALFAEAA